MYVPPHFAQQDPAEIAAVVTAHPLAMLMHLGADGTPAADPVPLLRSADGTRLQGHVARANPLWRYADGATVLAVFQGGQAYVSPNWYPTKAETHRVVPTWNYRIVQARGVLHAVHDIAWIEELVERLTLRHEAAQPRPWAVADAPADFRGQMMRAIVGIDIAVGQWTGKWKIGQNRSAADRDGVARAHAAGPDDARELAAAMRTTDATASGAAPAPVSAAAPAPFSAAPAPPAPAA